MEGFKYVIHLLLLTVFFYASVAYHWTKKKRKWQFVYYIVSFALIIFLSVYLAFRDIYFDGEIITGGMDAHVYKERFENATSMPLAESLAYQQYEYGYGLFVYFIRLLTPSYIVYEIIYYAILFIVASATLRILDLRKGIVSFILIFVYIAIPFFDSMNIARNMLAYFLAMLSLALFTKKKTISSLVIAAIASSIHISAIILFAIYFAYLLMSRSKKKKAKIAFVIVISLFTIAASVLINVFRPILLTTRYALYFAAGNGQLPIGLIIERFAALALYLIFIKKRIIDKRYVYLSLVTLGVAIAVSFLQLALPVLYRVNVICGIGCFFTFNMLNTGYQSLKKSNCKRLAYAVVVLAFFALKINSTVTETIQSYGLDSHQYVWEVTRTEWKRLSLV